MNQSNAIAGFLVLAFIVFITVRGELPVYMGLLLADPSNAQPAATPAVTAAQPQQQASSGDSLSKASDALASVAKLLPLAL